jgi:hypothetical protein
MTLNCVTITGADDETDPEALQELSARYPFVEWGILIGSHIESRFPSVDWIHRLAQCRLHSNNAMKLSLHVCGRPLREIASGISHLDRTLGPTLYVFRRVQLNWHGLRMADSVSENVLKAFFGLDGFGWDPTLIFQLDGVNDQLFRESSRRFACVGLLDQSHGAGLLPNEWPSPHSLMACGWAGGLSPENLKAEIPRIAAKAHKAFNYWIDMETHVRTDDGQRLDLERVNQCLQIAAKFVDVDTAAVTG